jgi:uncharacterized protein YutE (UPF0331/DUF86 family)
LLSTDFSFAPKTLLTWRLTSRRALGRDVPDYAGAIDRLAEIGILPHDFAARFRGIAGFRNVLVHGYLDVDVTHLHNLLNSHLDDFSVFARHIRLYLGLPDADR